MSLRNRFILTPLLAAIALSACGGNDSTSTASDAPTTESSTTETPTTEPSSTEAPPATLDPAVEAMMYTEAGPYPVGVTTLELAAGNKVEVWYPAVEGTTGAEFYDTRDFVPPAIKALLTADVPARYDYTAGRDAEVADGQYPVVLFSHGYSGMRFQSTFLTAHLASWGMVVAAPDHWSRDLFHVLSAPVGDRESATAELLGTLDLVTSGNDDPASLLQGHIDLSRVIALGHSAGGGTIVSAANDDRIDGYISMASGVLGMGSSDATTIAPPTFVNKPSFFIAGALDAIISAEESTRPSFEAVPGPSRLWIIDGVGHNGFDDFCTFGNGSGIIGVALASGLGPLLDAQPQLKTLGQDGCIPPAEPVELGFPIIKHAVTAQLRFWFGDDATPVGLDNSVSDQYELAVSIDSKD
jgi:predicted dienelactone hydrolase